MIDFSNKQTGREELADTLKIPLGKFTPYFQPTNKKTYQHLYNSFVKRYNKDAQMINSIKYDGIGPGEIISWFLFDNVELGGKNSPIDLTLDTGKPLAEVKGGKYDKANHALVDFKISKDSDPAVRLLHTDMGEYNDTYREITGGNLPGWSAGCITTNGLNFVSTVSLNSLSKRKAKYLTDSINMSVHPNGLMHYGKTQVCNFHEGNHDLCTFMSGKVQYAVNQEISTLRKIIIRWRGQVMKDYIKTKPFALINTTTLQMMHYGKITPSMISLYRISRNQPQARIFLKE